MLLQQGLGEHPPSTGMPLLISAAINQFLSSHQPHRHPLHLLILFLSISVLPHDFFPSALFPSLLWFSPLNRGKGRLKSYQPSSSPFSAFFSLLKWSWWVFLRNVSQLDLKFRVSTGKKSLPPRRRKRKSHKKALAWRTSCSTRNTYCVWWCALLCPSHFSSSF